MDTSQVFQDAVNLPLSRHLSPLFRTTSPPSAMPDCLISIQIEADRSFPSPHNSDLVLKCLARQKVHKGTHLYTRGEYGVKPVRPVRWLQYPPSNPVRNYYSLLVLAACLLYTTSSQAVPLTSPLPGLKDFTRKPTQLTAITHPGLLNLSSLRSLSILAEFEQ